MKQQNECTYCGYVYETDSMYLVDGKYYCSDCVGICDNCGSAELYDDLTVVNYDRDDTRYICSHCLNSSAFFQCSDCNQYYTNHRYYGSYLGRDICENCSDNYGVCDECENIFPIDELEYYSHRDAHLCADCIRNIEEDMSDLINDYSYKPYPIFYGESNDNCFLGIELEVDNETDSFKSEKTYIAAKYLTDTYGGKLYLKHDSSLSHGFEIVSHPCSADYHISQFGWNDILNICKSHSLLSHDTTTCGLHIHISREFFGSTQNEQDLHIAKLILLISKFYFSHILKFSRRKEHELHWCKNPEINYESNDNEKTIIDKMKCCKSNGRYQAINLENASTVEFRIFKGTLNLNTFLAAIQFVIVISDYAKRTKLSDIPCTSWKDIFMSSNYKELNEYLKRMELI